MKRVNPIIPGRASNPANNNVWKIAGITARYSQLNSNEPKRASRSENKRTGRDVNEIKTN